MTPEAQEFGRKLVLLENAYNMSGSVQALYEENHAEEDVELCIGQRVGRIHSLHIDKEVWLRAELGSGSRLEVGADKGQEYVNSMQESDYPTEESKRKFIHESFKIDENEILNRDKKLKEEVIKMFLDNFSALVLHSNHY